MEWLTILKIATKNYINRLAIKKVIVNDNHLIVLWNDNTKSVSTCSEEDDFDIYVGIVIAYMRKLLGTKTFHAKMERALKKVEMQKKGKKYEQKRK